MIGWHFAGETLRDESPLPHVGEDLPTIDDPVPCVRGYHASPTAFAALKYAPGPRVARVELSGIVIPHGSPHDKWSASNRRMLTDYVDVSNVLLLFARRCALDVVHMWDAPDVVLHYLRTGDEAARIAAWDAARVEAWDAAWDPARDAARDAAEGAANAANAAWEAARVAAAAADAAWDAVKHKQTRRLAKMLGRVPALRIAR